MQLRITLLAILAFFSFFSATGLAEEVGTENAPSFPENKGFFALRIASNTPSIAPASGLINKWDRLLIEGSDGSSLTLLPEKGGSRSTQIFTSMLPEGSYQLIGLGAGKGAIGKAVSLQGQEIRFEIRAGQITNPGMLIYQPVGNLEVTFLRYPRNDDVQEFLAQRYGQLMKASASKAILGWSDNDALLTKGRVVSGQTIVTSNSVTMGIVGTITMGVMQAISDRAGAIDPITEWHETKEPAARLALAKQHSYALNNIQALESGEIIAGSNFGQVVMLDAVRGWRNIDIGDAREITAVNALTINDLLIGGEEGLLLASNDSGKSWTRLKPPVAQGLIVSITRTPKETLIASLIDNQLLVHSQKKGSDHWIELKQLTIAQASLITNWPTAQGIAAIQQGKYVLLVPGEQIHAMDLESRTWVSHTGPGWARELRQQGEMIYTSQTFRQPPAYSKDAGASWSPYRNNCSGTFSWVVSLATISESEQYLLCFSTGMFSGSTSLLKTTDAGNTWVSLVKDMPVTASQMFATPKMVIYVDSAARVYLSRDAGASWTHLSRSTAQ